MNVPKEYAMEYFQPRVMRHKAVNKADEYAIHDVFFNAFDQAVGWSIEALSPRRSSVQALKEELVRLRDLAEQAGEAIYCGDASDEHGPEDIRFWLDYIDQFPLPWDESVDIVHLEDLPDL